MTSTILTDGKWIRATLLPQVPGKKTQRYSIESTYDTSYLGLIKWYAPWRGYAFYPWNDCVFETNCLETICGWIKALNEVQRRRKDAS